MSATRARGRHRARECAFRVAYQADVNGESPAAVWETRAPDEKLSAELSGWVGDLVRVLDGRRDEVDGHLATAAAHWALDRLSATDRSVLRAAVAELLARPDSPARVVIDEAIEIARRYGSEESGRFVNGVLDPVARALRPEEMR